MRKQLLFLALVLTVACGKTSKIVNDVAPRSTEGSSEWVIPLSDAEIDPIRSPVPYIGPFLSGLAKTFIDLAASGGQGRIQLSMIQQIPEIPDDMVKEVKISRVFFYIEPTKGSRIKSLFTRWWRGEDNVTFGFLDKIALKLSSHSQPEYESWKPKIDMRNLDFGETTPLLKIFENPDPYGDVVDIKEARSLVVLKYDRANASAYVRKNQFGQTIIMAAKSAKEANKIKWHLVKHRGLKDHIKRAMVLNDSILIELMKDPVAEEAFNVVVSEEAEKLKELGQIGMEVCNPSTCMDLKTPNINLLPLIQKGNGVKLDAYINAVKAPESFKLKGFILIDTKQRMTK